MKKFLLLAAAAALPAIALADIHQPPAADQGPTRKLGRALGNLAFGVTEIPYTIATVNEKEGNSAGCSYGVVKGVGRTLARLYYGVEELVTFPIPIRKAKYAPPYKSDTIWILGGYSEFPPELGFESKCSYVRRY